MFGHCGKKLLFMGQDFGQEREWSEERELDWFQLKEKNSKGLHEYMKELLKLYRTSPCMYERDHNWESFRWMNADDTDRSTYSFVRKSVSGSHSLLFVVNMTPMTWEKYRIFVPEEGPYHLVLNSDEARFGGSAMAAESSLIAKKDQGDSNRLSIVTDLPPYSARVYSYEADVNLSDAP